MHAFGFVFRSGVLLVLAWASMSTATTRIEAARILRREHVDAARASGLAEDASLDEVIAALSDPWTRHMPAAEARAFLSEVGGNATVGIGLPELLSIDLDGATSLPMVVTPVPGSPAARARLEPHDLLLAIDGASTQKLPWVDIMRRLRGLEGTWIRLHIRRGAREFNVALRRERLPAAGGSVQAAMSDATRVSVLHLAIGRVTPATPGAVRAALAKSGDAPVVIDLRNNPGGDLSAALEVIGAFLGETDVARLEVAGGFKVLRSTGAAHSSRCLAVLVNEGTASAAELVSTALATRGSVHVSGMPTMRKCLVHSLIELEGGDAVLFTKGHLQGVGGTSLCDFGAPLHQRVSWRPSLRGGISVPATVADKQFVGAARAGCKLP